MAAKKQSKKKIQNGQIVRRKIKNSYMDLVIKGTAKKTPDGWKVGNKTIPQGRGTVNVSSGYYLDKATGIIFAKRERNSKRVRNIAAGFYDGSGVFHPIRSSKDYDGKIAGETGKKPRHTRSKKKQVAAKKASMTARERATTKARKSTTSRLSSRSLFQSVPLKKKRNSSAMNEAIKNRKEFAGQFQKIDTVYAASGTPEGLSKLGNLVELVLADKSKLAFRENSPLILAQDNQHKLHIVSTKPGPNVDNEPGNYGPIARVEYVEAKPHLGEPEPIQWFHKLGEITGERPNLLVDKFGKLRIQGGNYSINWRGIIN